MPKKKTKSTMETQFKYVPHKQARGSLTEGRNYGLGFAFLLRKGNELHGTGPISPCREYINDQLASEHTGKTCSAWGYTGNRSGILNDDLIYMGIEVLPYNHGGPYASQPKDAKFLKEHPEKIAEMINGIEEMLKLPDRTKISHLEGGVYLLTIPKFWSNATFLISLHSLLARVALEAQYKEGDALAFFKNSDTSDQGYVKQAVAKLEKMIAGNIPSQKWNNPTNFHTYGIVNSTDFK